MKKKRLVSLVVSLCMAASAVTPTITAHASEYDTNGYYYDETTGVLTFLFPYSDVSDCFSFDGNTCELTLKGEVDRDAISHLSYKEYVKSIKAEAGTVLPNYCNSLFSDYQNCTTIDLSKADTSNVTDMSFMFNLCSKLEYLDVSGFDTSNVTNMCAMFQQCSKLGTVDVSGFDTSKVTNMSYMFNLCSELESIDLSEFDTSNVTDMRTMFQNCDKLKSLDLSGFKTSNVTNMSYMFNMCSGLESLYLSEFDTSNVTDMKLMFYLCTNLETLTLGRNFDELNEEAFLYNFTGWVNVNDPATKVSGNGGSAVIKNVGTNTYKRITAESLTYPTNIKVTYNKKKHQVRFTWDKVEGADKYSIAVYQSGKWRVQTQDITDTVYTSPKNLTPGSTYKVAIAARVNGNWDTDNAIKNAVTVTVK